MRYRLGIVVQIFTAAARGAPMEKRERVTALADEGLVGDRYSIARNRRGPDYQLTLNDMRKSKMIRANLRQRGKLIQLAFVPKDFDGTLRFWVERMGVGPFYLLEHLPYQNVIYRGQPIAVDATVALAYWNDLQIEIIKQHNDNVLSGYTETGGIRGEGLHHVLVESDDVDALHKSWLDAGATELMTGDVPGAGRFIYLDVGDGGPHVELVHLEPRFLKLFGFMQEQAEIWDGSDPIRQVPEEGDWRVANAP